jgi:anaerobic C4-dicarboxylate transporter DcuA
MNVILFYVEILIMLAFLIWGLKKGGALGIGLMAFLALLVMIFVFRLPPGAAPITAVLIILSIGIAGGMLEASGGLDYLVYQAGNLIKRKPAAIGFVAPFIVFFFVFGIGTANIALALEPIIAETAINAKVRPERPLVATVLAANLALLCSPAASSAVFAVSIVSAFGIGMGQYLSIVLPTALISTLILCVFMLFRGKKLVNDPEYLKRMEQGLIKSATPQADPKTQGVTKFGAKVKISVLIFIAGIIAILLFGIFPELAPTFMVGDKQVLLRSNDIVQIFMYVIAGLIVVIAGVSPMAAMKTKILPSAISAAVAVLGPGWVGSTIFNAPANAIALKSGVGALLTVMPWTIIIIFSIVAILVMSQTAILSIIYPLALGLGIPAPFMVAIVQCVNVNFVIPAQPTLLFAEQLDTTGTSKRKRFVIPGFFVTIISILIGLAIIKITGIGS